MANKIFKNETAYDPGRFRHKVQFWQQTSTPDGAGGSIVVLSNALSTIAIKEVFPRRVNEQGQLIVEGGASDMNDVWYFIIRKRDSFTPVKSMNLICENWVYTIRNIVEVDIPVNYQKILCVKSDRDVEFLQGGNGFFYIYADDPNISVDGDGNFTYTSSRLENIIQYSIYAEQLSSFLQSDQIIYDTTVGKFTILIPGFALVDGYRLIVFINYIGSI